MDWFNSEGIRRSDLLIYMKDRRFVREARRINRCILCRRPSVNEAGLCDPCYAMLDGEELRVAARWLTGEGP